MQTRLKILFSIACMASFAMFSACDKFDIAGLVVGQSPKVNFRFAQSLEYNRTISPDTLKASSDVYSVYVIADIHVSESTVMLQRAINSFLSDASAEKFVLNLGDNTSKKGSMDLGCEALNPLRKNERKLFSTPGNHDLYFSEWDCYRKWFPTSSYVFFVKTPSACTDAFLCIDSSEGTLGTDQRKWLEDKLMEVSRIHPRNIIVFTHTNFFRIDNSQGLTGNFTTDETYDLLSLFSQYGVDMVLTGHDHHYESQAFRGVNYLTLNAFVEDKTKHSCYLFTFGQQISFKEIVIK